MFAFNKKGFNLFSALVATIFLMAGTMMAVNLVSTENNFVGQVYSMRENFHLSDAATLARANALQSFNYSFRARIENFLARPDLPRIETEGSVSDTKYQSPSMTINMRNVDGSVINDFESWQDLLNNFECAILLNKSVCKGSSTVLSSSNVNSTASGTNSNFYSVLQPIADDTTNNIITQIYGRYAISLSGNSSDLSEVLNSAVSAEDENFFEVIGCNVSDGGAPSCPIGTFYFNIPLNKLTDAQYERMPKIVVRDIITQEEIKIAILPRANIKIYIPIRFFKALWEARTQAMEIKNSYNNLNDYRMGFCDVGSCVPRTEPLTPASEQDWDKPCYGEGANQSLAGNPLGATNYSVDGSNAGASALSYFSVAQVCDAIKSISNWPSPFEFVSAVSALKYNKILYANSDKTVALTNSVADCPLYNYEISGSSVISKNVTDVSTTQLYCTKLREIKSDFFFREENPLYVVKGADARENDFTTNNYWIRFVMGFEEMPGFSESDIGECSNNAGVTSYSCTKVK